MTDKYILKDEAVNAVKSLISKMPAKDNYAKGYDAALGQALIAVREVPPAAGVMPVKRGRWIIADDVEHFIAICSECGRTEDSRDIKDMPYCHCGARMDGDTEWK